MNAATSSGTPAADPLSTFFPTPRLGSTTSSFATETTGLFFLDLDDLEWSAAAAGAAASEGAALTDEALAFFFLGLTDDGPASALTGSTAADLEKEDPPPAKIESMSNDALGLGGAAAGVELAAGVDAFLEFLDALSVSATAGAAGLGALDEEGALGMLADDEDLERVRVARETTGELVANEEAQPDGATTLNLH